MEGIITKPVKVSIKPKRKNPRAFRIWESDILNQTMVLAMEIQARIEETSKKDGLPLEEMNPSMMSSHSLYVLTDSYLALYNALMREGLIRTANLTNHPQIH